MSVRTSPNADLPTGSQSPDGYFVVVHGRRLGPLAMTELRNAGVTRDSWAWRPGLADWCRAEQIDELQQVLFAEPPPLPTAVPVEAVASDVQPSVVDFKRAMPFVAGIVLCYLLLGPLLSVLSLIGLHGGVIEWFIVEIPFRVCCAGASFLRARALRLPVPWAWAIPSVLEPRIGMIESVGLAVFARRRLKAAGVAMGFFGPRG